MRYMTHFIIYPKNESCKMGEPTDETSYYGPEGILQMNYMTVLKTVAQGGKLILEDIFLIKMVNYQLYLLIYNPEWKV
jgi:hypothetical protein